MKIKSNNFFISFLLILIFLISVGGIQATNTGSNSSISCSNSAILNSANKILSSLVGKNFMSHYSYEGYHYWENSYFVSYKFLYNLNITKPFISHLTLLRTNRNNCNNLILQYGENIVKSFNSSNILSFKQAKSIFKKYNYNLSTARFGFMPGMNFINHTNFLTPGYGALSKNIKGVPIKLLFINLNSTHKIISYQERISDWEWLLDPPNFINDWSYQGNLSATTCSNSTIINFANKTLLAIVGKNFMSHYSYEGYKMNKILSPSVINLSGIIKDPVNIIVSYNFLYKFNSTTTFRKTSTINLVRQNIYKCNNLLMIFNPSDLVEPFNPSDMISFKQANAIFKKYKLEDNYKYLGFGLIPIWEDTIKNGSKLIGLFFTPGYGSDNGSSTMYIFASNSTIYFSKHLQSLNSHNIQSSNNEHYSNKNLNAHHTQSSNNITRNWEYLTFFILGLAIIIILIFILWKKKK